MTLKEYIKKNKIPLSAIADGKELKTSSQSQIKKKKKIASAAIAMRIQQATGGAVTVMELLFPEANDKGQGAQIVRRGRHFPK